MRGVLILFIASLLLIAGCSTGHHIETREMMDTFVTIEAFGGASDVKEDVGGAYSEISKIERVLSNYDNSTQVYKLNSEGKIEGADQELIDVVKDAKQISELTDGAFDITVQPILDLYKETFGKRGEPPKKEEIKEALKKVGYKYVSIDNKTISFEKEDMAVTLGGIAKGYAVDVAAAYLEEEGIDNFLVNAGGDLYASGFKDEKKWRVGLQNPREKSQYITIFYLTDKAVATSGDYERFFVENKTVHHIIDPKTGKSATDCISVSIIADTAEVADALATGVFVMGPEKGMELVEEISDVEALIIDSDKKITKSSGLKQYEIP